MSQPAPQQHPALPSPLSPAARPVSERRLNITRSSGRPILIGG